MTKREKVLLDALVRLVASPDLNLESIEPETVVALCVAHAAIDAVQEGAK
jgi:hypothetical protein